MLGSSNIEGGAAVTIEDKDIIPARQVDGTPDYIAQISLPIQDDLKLFDIIDNPSQIEIETYIAREIKNYTNYTGRTLWSSL